MQTTPTKEKILNAAMTLVSEKGYLGATTREIAREAAVTELTLFRHFGSKEKLFELCLARNSFLPALRELMPDLGFLMLGGPGETEDTLEETLAFVSALNLDALKITIGVRIYPQTKLAKVAIQDGLIGPDDDLLFPKFYMVKGLEGWLREIVSKKIKEHRNWVM